MKDEKWKLSKSYSTKNTSSSTSSSSSSNFTRSFSTRTSSSTTTGASTASSSSSFSNKSPFLRKSSSLKYAAAGEGGGEGYSEKGGSSASIGRKCTNLAKEQKARFYIMRRCVAMLVCWHKHAADP
ncbi:unnamed protein product [Linum trigynum]|uniref:Uncharacterized protein n=1 Tax=Linum trigynum TaxID=586398 RepID=A0AAV2FUG1_9ROSI